MAEPTSTSSQMQRPPKKKSVFCCNPLECRCGRHRFPIRVVLAILLHLCLQTCYNARVVLNVAIVEMVVPTEEEKVNVKPACPQHVLPNATMTGGQFPWSRMTKSLVLYSFYIGYTCTQIPGGWLADKYGGRYVLLITVFVTSLSTAAFPIAVQKYGHLAAVGLRLLLGVVHGPTLPAFSSMISGWFPRHERKTWGGIAFSGTSLGTILGNIITGELIHAYGGWPIAFYFWSGYAAIFLVIAIFFVFSFPDTHPFISQSEVDYITMTNAASSSATRRTMKTPWKGILLNGPYWANVAAQFGHNYIYFTLVTYLPTYMREILQFDVKSDGLFSAIPFIALWISSLTLSGTSRFFIKHMSEPTFDKVFGAGSNVASAALLLGAVYAGCNRVLCIGLYIVSMIVKAFYYVTLPTNITALSLNYGGSMFGLCNAIGSISGILGNLLIGFVTKNRDIFEWKIVFWITFGIEAVTTIIFFIFSSSERQDFDYLEGDLRDI